jgi:hypothetical protein
MPLYEPAPFDESMLARVAEDHVQYSLRVFHDLQDDLEEFCRYLRPEPEHLNVFSTKLWGIILRACAEIDSQLNALLDELNGPAKDERTIRDYIACENNLRLSSFTLSLRGGPPRLFAPFESFAASPSKVPDWWTDYNSVKHRRLNSLKKATLENAIHAVGGLYVVLYRQWGEYWMPRPMTFVAGQKMAKSSAFFLIERSPWP